MKAQPREGLGLGLFIVKTFVEAHGGRVEVESIPDQETCFAVRLPAWSVSPLRDFC
jgi:signal transduction histidine kinase